MTGLIVFAHGSTVESANDAVRHVSCELAGLGGYEHLATAFLEGGKPNLAEASKLLIERGVTRIVVLPYFLTLGMHLKRDLPKLMNEVREMYPGVEVESAMPLDGHPALIQALHQRAQEVLHQRAQEALAPSV